LLPAGKDRKRTSLWKSEKKEKRSEVPEKITGRKVPRVLKRRGEKLLKGGRPRK